MKKIFELYLDFSDDANIHLGLKLEGVKTVEEGFKILEEAGWSLSPQMVSDIKEKAGKAESISKVEKELIAKKLAEQELLMKAKDEKVMAAQEAAAAKGGKPSKDLDVDPSDTRFM